MALNLDNNQLEVIFQKLLKRNWIYVIQEFPKTDHTPETVKEMICEELEDYNSLVHSLHIDKYLSKADLKTVKEYVLNYSNKIIKLHKPNIR